MGGTCSRLTQNRKRTRHLKALHKPTARVKYTNILTIAKRTKRQMPGQSFLVPSGGCSEQLSNWSKENPTQIWYEFRNKSNHWNMILEGKRVGCAASKCGGPSVYLWCYIS